MKKLCAGLIVVGLLTLAGCGNKSTTGGDKDKGGTFTITGPMTATTVKQEGSANVDLKFDRGKDSDQDIKVKFEHLPTGVTIEPDNPTVHAGDKKDLGLTVKAAKDAALGKHTINVVATPSKGGKPVNTAFEIEVKAK